MKMKTKMRLTAVFEEAEEGGYIAFIEELPGVNTQGETLDEAKANLLEALDMVLKTQRELSEKELGGRKFIKEELEFA
jgi:predicted RNase H-like HicB family nuclease